MINNVTITGNLTKDPEIRGNQGRILTFSIAHNERYRDASGKYQNSVSYFDVIRFGSESACKYLQDNLKKGMKVTISGRLRQNRWEANGRMFYSVQIVAESIDFFHPQNRTDRKGTDTKAPSHNEFDPYGYYDNGTGNTDFGSMYAQQNNVLMDPY